MSNQDNNQEDDLSQYHLTEHEHGTKTMDDELERLGLGDLDDEWGV